MVRFKNLQCAFLGRFGMVFGMAIDLRLVIVLRGLEKLDGLDEDVRVLASEVGFAAQHRFAVKFLVDGNLKGCSCLLKMYEHYCFLSTI